MSFDPTKYGKIYNSFFVKLEFEFYSYYSVDKTVNILRDHLKRNIIVDNNENIISDKYTFEVKTNANLKHPYIKLITGKLDYQDARFIIIKVFEKIKEFGYTESDNFMRAKVFVDPNQSMVSSISNVDRLKHILDFDENFMSLKFDSLVKTPFVRSIYNIIPINKNLLWNTSRINSNEFEIPNAPTYGVDYTELDTGAIKFNYIGGENYETKTIEALDCVDYYLLSIAKTLASSEYSDENQSKLWSILDDLKDTLQAYVSPKEFIINYPDITLSVDLKKDEQVLVTYWDKIKDQIFYILANSDIKKGYINYDSYLGRIQLKDMKFITNEMKEVEIIDCKISGSYLTHCYFYRSIVENSRLNRCNVYADTEIKNSRAHSCFFNGTTEVIDSMVLGKPTVMNGLMSGGIFIEGNKGKNGKFSKHTKVVKYTEIAPIKLKVD